jgi:hypothetical protein
LKRTQVLPVLAGALVDERVQLEVDLIEAAREMDGQRLTERPRLDAIEEAGRQPEIDQVGRASVEPVLGKPEVTGHAITRRDQCLWERLRLRQHAGLSERDHVDVARWSVDEPQREQRRATDDNELVPFARSGQLLGKRGQQLIGPRGAQDVSHLNSR